MSWRSVSAFDGGDNAAPAHIGPHLSRQWATHCTFGQPLRTFHSCRSAHEDNTGRRTAQKSALDVGEPATQCTGEGGRAVHGQGERRAHHFLHLDLCPPRWLFGRTGKFGTVRSLSPYGVLNSVHKLTVTYYGEITIEPILNPEFDVDHDFEVKNGCFQSLFPRFRVISACSTGRASHSDHFSGQVSMATILQDFYLFRRGFHSGVRDHLPDEG